MGVSCFNGGEGEGGVCFTDGGGTPFLSGGCPIGGHRFWWGGFEKNH